MRSFRKRKKIKVAWTEEDHSHGTHVISVCRFHKDYVSDRKLYGIWRLSKDRKSFWTLGQLKNHFCTVHEVHGSSKYDSDKYIGVPLDIFKYRKGLKIRWLRRLFREIVDTKRGQVYKTQYGYIPRKRMKYLLENRKIDNNINSSISKVLLTKRSDWEMHSR